MKNEIKQDKSPYEVDSEFKTKFECVEEATTKSDSWEIVTSDVEGQPSPTRKTEVVSIALSGPVQTATQSNKPVSKLKQGLSRESERASPFIEGRHSCEKLSSFEEDDETHTRVGEPT